MPYKSKKEQNEYQTRWRTEWRQKWYEEHGPCKNCGSDRNLRIFSLAERPIPPNIWTLSVQRKEAFLAECVVLCASCHRIASFKRLKERREKLATTVSRQATTFQQRDELSATRAQQATSFDPASINVEGKEVVITVTIKVL